MDAINSITKEKVKDFIIEEGSLIIISPNILHNMSARSDVVYIEIRVTKFDRNPDVHSKEGYEEHIRSLDER